MFRKPGTIERDEVSVNVNEGGALNSKDASAPQQPAKPAWRSPRLEELGNLRDFVQHGNGFGKSGPSSDGNSDPGGEMMS